jgi:hypothetical protein
MAKEVRRVEGFKAWHLVRFREFREMRRRFPGRVSLGPSGDPREPDVVNKFRISMSEGGREDLVAV